MKKLILIISLFFISTFSYSQSFNKIYKCVCIKFENKKWIEYKTSYPDNIFVILKDNEVIITNESECKLVTYGVPEITQTKDGQLTTWDAYDWEGRSCLFMMKNFYNSTNAIYTIAYLELKIAFQYLTNN
jgi:hypothetical protein